jgi:hypothetical protein
MLSNCYTFPSALRKTPWPRIPSAPPRGRSDVYHVLFAKAAPGKAAPEADFLKTQCANAPMKGHYLVLRHQDGEDWDYVVIEHLGTKATVDPATPPPPAATRDLSDWHNDTFVSGPPWAEFPAPRASIKRPGRRVQYTSFLCIALSRAPRAARKSAPRADGPGRHVRPAMC